MCYILYTEFDYILICLLKPKQLSRAKLQIFKKIPFQRFHTEGADVMKVDGYEMVRTMAANVEVMMQHKIDAIKVNKSRTTQIIVLFQA